jgi:hypothetical protein
LVGEEEELTWAKGPEACLSSRDLLLLVPRFEWGQEGGNRTERISTRIISPEVSAIAVTKRIIFTVFLKVGLIILVVYIGLITIVYESKAYYSYSFKLLSVGISIITVY